MLKHIIIGAIITTLVMISVAAYRLERVLPSCGVRPVDTYENISAVSTWTVCDDQWVVATGHSEVTK